MVAPESPPHPPKLRKPLRERCKIRLTIIPISYREWNKAYDCNYELTLVFEDEEAEEKKPDDEGDQPTDNRAPSPSPSTRSLIEKSHLVEVMDGLYIALLDNEDVDALRTFDDKPFTHVVRVSYSVQESRGWNHPLPRCNWRRDETPRDAPVQRLHLVCPEVSLDLVADQTAVGPDELHAAREFLSLALPYGSTKWWPEEERNGVLHVDEWGEKDAMSLVEEEEDDVNAQVIYLAPRHGLHDTLDLESDCVEQDDKVNVLIVAPASRAVDVLSILFCYLAFLEDTTPGDYYFDEVWDAVTLGKWSKGYVELVARSY